MLWVLVALFAIVWIMGFVSGFTMSGFIHLFLLLAIVILVVAFVRRRRPTS